jgi:DNA-binding IclR family transcriptional regulator
MPRPPEESASPSGVLRRTLRILELLAGQAQGLPLFDIAERMGIPRSATHRLLAGLVAEGYVRQEREHGAYLLTAKIASLGFTYLSGAGITDLAQPILDRLAQTSGELVRAAIVDDAQLTFVAKAQGALTGLRYDPETGQIARLSCSASGLALLSTLSDEEALALIARQGFGTREEFGPNAPQSDEEIRTRLSEARRHGYALTEQIFSPWMNAMAAPIRARDGDRATGTVSIAGPHIRLSAERMRELAPALLAAAAELSLIGPASPALAAGTAGRRPNIFA